MKHLTLTLAFALIPFIAIAQKTESKKSTTSTTKTTSKSSTSKNSTSKSSTSKSSTSKASPSKPELTPEEIAAKQQAEAARLLAEERAKRMDEMLPNTRALVFIDSLVVDKDNFLAQLRIPTQVGRYVAPERILSSEHADTRTGAAAFVSSEGTSAYYSTPDTLGNLHLSVAYKNSNEWTEPLLIEELYGYEHQDYPFLQSDGVTLYFAATSDESLGGLDLFVTRYNEETRQYVRPQNLGFPYNSTANDYLLAIDEEVGIGALVTDRRQPDDKVCIYWFIAEGRRNIYDYETEDEEAEAIVRGFAEISSIADTQEDHEESIAAVRQAWESALAAQSASATEHFRFIITNHTVYTSLSQFLSEEARTAAKQWTEADAQLSDLEIQQRALRKSFAADRSDDTAALLRKLEADIQRLRVLTRRLEKDYRAAERRALIE